MQRVDYRCSFCNKDQCQVNRLVAGPNGVYICNECAIAFSEEKHEPLAEKGLRCSFCGKDQAHIQYLSRSGSKGTRICDECVDLCLEIFAEEQGISSN